MWELYYRMTESLSKLSGTDPGKSRTEYTLSPSNLLVSSRARGLPLRLLWDFSPEPAFEPLGHLYT